MSIINFPNAFYQDIRSWLKYDDQIAFAMVNVTISKLLLKCVRIIRKSDFQFENIGLISDPYRQLMFSVADNVNFKAKDLDNSLICSHLETTVSQLTSLMQFVKKVRSLKLRNHGSTTDSQLQLIFNWISDSRLGLTELGIENYEMANLPVIPNLESLEITNTSAIQIDRLNILSFSNLQVLKLRCNTSIEDISSLDGIHELHLFMCDGIRDISCLNHNYKIVIAECSNIIDYSNCFRCSKIIDICCPSDSEETIQSVDLSHAAVAREIYFWGGDFTNSLILPQSSSLRCVHVNSHPGPVILPSTHQIREITITNCKSFKSFTNFDGIYSVKLCSLKISTLGGLGSGNHVVEVDRCHLIEDFSLLRNCEKVTIRNCEGFQDMDQLRGVKDFTFAPVDVDELPQKMNGVTCLVLPRVPDDLLSLKIPNSLEKFVIESWDSDVIEQLPLSPFLAGLPKHVRKIQISLVEDEFSMLYEGDAPIEDFTIEFKKNEVHFLRKLA